MIFAENCVIFGESMRSHGKHGPVARLARAIRARRKSLKTTQKEVALLANCGPDFLYDLENGKSTLRLDKVLEVMNVLGLELVVRRGKDGIVIDAALSPEGDGS